MNTSNVPAHPKLTGITLAVTDMDRMIKFYRHLLKIEFNAVEMYGAELYESKIEGMKILFCPAAIARNTATQNRLQLELEVTDLDVLLSDILQLGGEILGEKQQEGSFIQVGIKDPDNNSIVLKQNLEG